MTATVFLPDAVPEKTPEFRRRRLFVLFMAGTVFGLGATGLLVYETARPAALQRPGPRRYPPAYRP